MLTLSEGIKIFIRLSATDMRKSIDSLCALIVDYFNEQPQSRHLFLFYNRDRNKVKIIYWDRNGFVLYYKRLEKKRFMFSKASNGNVIEITQNQLQWLLAGLYFQLMNNFSDLDYSGYY